MIDVTDYLLFFRGGEACAELYKAVIAMHLDVAVMGVHDCLGNGKTKTVMLVLAVPGRIHAVEPFKDPLPVFYGNLIAGIDHRKLCDSIAI